MNSFQALRIGWVAVSLASGALCPFAGRCETPVTVTVCELNKNLDAYNHKLIQVTAFVSHGFEDFTLFDPTCDSWSSPTVWLEYGGTEKSGTMYCCGVTAERSRPKQLVVEDIPVPLVEDQHFVEFDKLINHAPDSVVHATLVGRFFAGKEMAFGRGYGHMGCCTLLAIQAVTSVEPHDREDLDYRAAADQPYTGKPGCWHKAILTDRPFSRIIQAQQRAEAQNLVSSLDDPRRVATETLAALLKIDKSAITTMKQVREARGRIVYEWSPRKKRESHMIVVGRPYWLSFYSKDARRVAWVAIAAYTSSCSKEPE